MSGEVDRIKLIEEKIRAEDKGRATATHDARELTMKLLLAKGYLPEEIEKDRAFHVAAGELTGTVSTDFIVSPGGTPYMAVKCAMELVSRERHILALSRVVLDRQIPLSIVTDGLAAHVMDTVSGRVLSERLAEIPARDDVLRRLRTYTPVPFPPERIEKQKRVLFAFECLACGNAPSEVQGGPGA
jgi:hypothetical protein